MEGGGEITIRFISQIFSCFSLEFFKFSNIDENGIEIRERIRSEKINKLFINNPERRNVKRSIKRFNVLIFCRVTVRITAAVELNNDKENGVVPPQGVVTS